MKEVIDLCETDVNYDLIEITDEDEIVRMNEDEINKLAKKLKKNKKKDETEVELPREMENILADFEVVEE